MKIILLIYCTSLLSMAFSFPKNTKTEKQIETQAKRDTSYSYVAADINSKEGTHIKTLTVIKNIDSKNNPINHKYNNWSDKIHENFEAFGKIPEVPDIDDLFEFTKNYNPKTQKSEKDIKIEIPISEKPSESEIKAQESEKPSVTILTNVEQNVEEKPKEEMKDIKIQNIPDDVELINKETNSKQKSQSLHYVPQPQGSKKINVKIQLPQSQPQNKYLTEYSTPQHSVRQYFISDESEKLAAYKKIPTYVKPNYDNKFPVYSPTLPPNNIPIRSYPNGNVNGQISGVIAAQSNKPSYLAPSKIKKIQNEQKQSTRMPVDLSSQTPYLAPSIKKTYEAKLTSKSKVLNQNGINNQTNNLEGMNNKSIVIPVNLKRGSNIPLGAVTRSRGLRF